MPEKFLFTVWDDGVAEQINRVMGKRVTIHYEEKVGLPTTCFGETRHLRDRRGRGRRDTVGARHRRADTGARTFSTGCPSSGSTAFGPRPPRVPRPRRANRLRRP